MSVYTRIEPDQLKHFLGQYHVGTLRDYRGISAGITNTNYFVDTTGGHWVLTVFERLTASELPFYLELMDHLAARGVPSAHPVARHDGSFFSTLAGKPAALVYRLDGASETSPSVAQCAALGTVLADMHHAADSFTREQANARGLGWIRATGRRLTHDLDAEASTLLNDEIAFQAAQDWSHLPRGIVHADLFRDNVLFEDDTVSGLIDFYYACSDYLLFDLAVVHNDWCLDDAGQTLSEHWAALSAAYADRRPLTDAEHAAWPGMLRAAALRFWVSRLQDYHFPRDGDVTHIKDPAPFRRTLLLHRDTPPPLTP